MNKFVLNIMSDNYYLNYTIFSGGEINFRLSETLRDLYNLKQYSLKARITSSDDVMALLMIKDALDHAYPHAKGRLFLPYVPYARQDRVCNHGEALSIKVFANLINSMNFDRVTTLDNHSDVATALINNCYNMHCKDLIGSGSDFLMSLLKTPGCVLVSPDAGSNKKVLDVAKEFGGLDIIRADKVRDTSTGDITGTEVYCDDLGGKTCVIVDDICDGGRTFIELAKKLKEKNAGQIVLYVTHGIFSRGLDGLFESGISSIFTTDSVCNVTHKNLYTVLS